MVLSVKPQAGGPVGAGDNPFVMDSQLGDSIFSGFRVSTNATTSTAVSIPAGSGAFQGFYIEEDGTGSANTANASSQGYLFIQLTLNGANKPTSITYLVTSTESTANAMRIARLDGGTGGTTVGSIFLQFSMMPLTPILHAVNNMGGLF